MNTPHPPEDPGNDVPGAPPFEPAEPSTDAAAQNYPPYSAPDQAATGSDAYSQVTPTGNYAVGNYGAGEYGEAATTGYGGSGYGHTGPAEPSAGIPAASPNAEAVRRWQIIAALAVAAAALTVIGFLLFGLQNRDGAAAPVTRTVTEVTEFEGAETTRTATTTATTTERETRTVTETQRDTVTRTATGTATATVTETETTTSTATTSAAEADTP